MSVVAQDPIHQTLRDGTRVLIRLVEPDDRHQFVEGFDRLSPRSRYLRFHTTIEELTDRQLDYLTKVDQVDHVAWVAVDEDHPHHAGIGVARFVRLASEPTVAEAAITVLDDYQGRGLGTILLNVLADAARERGITTFRAYVLGENTNMLAVLDRLGPRRTVEQEGVYQIDVELAPDRSTAGAAQHGADADPDGELDSAADRVFRAVTGKRLPAMHTTAPPAWMSEDIDDGGPAALHERCDQLLVSSRRAPDADDSVSVADSTPTVRPVR